MTSNNTNEKGTGMDIWIIIRGSWDDRTIMGVVHSRDAADALTATTQFLDQYDSEKLHAQVRGEAR